ncbi:MAG: TlpA disulfide reductase family protein [Weeksellaceae bacterium]|nr:TlpA disulfide reductase family protein [Weeksellaceae bacterium]
MSTRVFTQGVVALLALITILISCQKEELNHVTLSGAITNAPPDLDSVYVFVPEGFQRGIPVMIDGSFSDTLTVSEGMYMIQIDDIIADIYLKNGDKLHMQTDYADEMAPVKFSGQGSSVEYSNILEEFNQIFLSIYSSEFGSVTDSNIATLQHKITEDYNALKRKNRNARSMLWRELDRKFNDNLHGLQNLMVSRTYTDSLRGTNMPQYQFLALEGTNINSQNWQGKYVYIDVWAQWCAPCIKELPALKQLSEQYADKNIEFVSLSLDLEKDIDKWKEAVQKHQMTWQQARVPQAWDSEFVNHFQINGIPRVIILDPMGGIIHADGPRPTDAETQNLLNSIL